MMNPNPSKARRHSSLSQSAPASPVEAALMKFDPDPDPSPDPDDSAESRDWSSLTDAALHSVLSRLSSLEAFSSFRAVCRSWRALPISTPALSAQPPLLLLHRSPTSESFYDLLRRRLYSIRLPWSPPCRRSLAFSHGFLISLSVSRSSRLRLWNPLSGALIRLPKSPRRLPRVILSSSPPCSVVCFRPSSHSLQFFSFSDPLWKFRIFPNTPIIHDMIFFRRRLYALTPGHRLAAIDLVPRTKFILLGPAIAPNSVPPGDEDDCEWMLAESGGNLLLVGICLLTRFHVFRWNFEGGGGGWRELLDLGGRALFLEDKGFAASVLPTCSAVKGNCIYYADCCERVYYEFSLEDQNLSTISLNPSCWLPHHRESCMPKIWVFPSLCCL